MKTTSLFFSAAFAVFALSGCNPSATETETAPPTEAAFVNEVGVLQLNNGAKWPANQETTDGINKMIEQIKAFEELQLPEEIVNYNQLGSGLNTTMTGIFDQCTMKGAAHDELHDFLVPLTGHIKTLSGTDVAAAQQALTETKAHLAQYQVYFE